MRFRCSAIVGYQLSRLSLQAFAQGDVKIPGKQKTTIVSPCLSFVALVCVSYISVAIIHLYRLLLFYSACYQPRDIAHSNDRHDIE